MPECRVLSGFETSRQCQGARTRSMGLVLAVTLCLAAKAATGDGQPSLQAQPLGRDLLNRIALQRGPASPDATTLVAAIEMGPARRVSQSATTFIPWQPWRGRSWPTKPVNAFNAKDVFVDELRLDWAPQGETAGPLVFGGMFAPRFGRAWVHAPDIFGMGFVEEYDFGEHFGIGGGFALKSSFFGSLNVRVSAYFRATEFEDSATVAWSGLRRPDGRARIAGWPQSLTVSAEGRVPVASAAKQHESIDWRIAILSHANEYGGTVRQNGIAVSLSRTTAIGRGARLTGLIEYVRFDNFDNEVGLRRHYLTGAIAVERGKWRLTGMATWRREQNPRSNRNRRDDVLATLSLGYRPVEHFELSGGYRHTRVSGSPAHTIGIFAVHEF